MVTEQRVLRRWQLSQAVLKALLMICRCIPRRALGSGETARAHVRGSVCPNAVHARPLSWKLSREGGKVGVLGSWRVRLLVNTLVLWEFNLGNSCLS